MTHHRATRPAALTLGIAGIFAAATLTACGEQTVDEGIPPLESATATSTAHADSITDTSDLRNLMAISTHVFTGRVESAAGTKALGPLPETQYSVLTKTAIKGEVPESVVVNQQGGARTVSTFPSTATHPSRSASGTCSPPATSSPRSGTPSSLSTAANR